MTVLGEAFIEVRADLGPFIKNLDAQVKKAAESMEGHLKKAVSDGLKTGGGDGDKLGDELGDGVSRGMKRKLGDKGKPPWVNISAALASALDDGISALPAEVKAGIVVAILATLPFVSAALAGAASAGLGAGLAAAGTALAFQYTEVEEGAKRLGKILRLEFVGAAQPFVNELLSAFRFIELRVASLRPQLDSLFANSSKFIGPLTEGIVDAVTFLIESFNRASDKLGPFVGELASGFALLGDTIGDAFEILAETGEDGEEGLRDLFTAVALLIRGAAELIAALAKLYGWVRQISLAVPPLSGLFAHFFAASDKAAAGADEYGQASDGLTEAIFGVMSATEKEEKALKDAKKAMDDTRDAVFGLIDADISYEESLDRLREALRENGKTLATTTDEGRENLRRFGDAIKEAQNRAEEQYAQGKLNSQQAKTLYDQEIQAILKIAGAYGVTESAIRKVYGEAIGLINIPDQEPSWLNRIGAAAKKAADALASAKSSAGSLSRMPAASSRGFQEYADGGFARTATEAIIGEAGPEVVIPLTKPGRAAQLLQRSGLANMLSAAATMVQVFIGNEQLDSRTVRIVEANNAAMGNSLAFGARGL